MLTGDSWNTICTFNNKEPDKPWSDYRLAHWENGEPAKSEIANADHVAAFDPPTALALIAEVQRLREALNPFARTAELDIGESETDDDLFQNLRHNRAPRIRVGHLRDALAVLAPAKEGGE